MIQWKGWEIWDSSAWRTEDWGGWISCMLIHTWKEEVKWIGLFSAVPSDRTSSIDYKLKHKKSYTTKNLLWKWQSTGTGCSEKLWNLFLWRYLKPTWTLPCATCYKESALAAGWSRWYSEVSSKPYDSVTLCKTALFHWADTLRTGSLLSLSNLNPLSWLWLAM